MATHSACRVVAWRGDTITPTTRSIVVGVDGDRDGQVAISAAFDTAHPSVIDWKEVESGELNRLSETLSPWLQRYPDAEVSCIVETEKPSRAPLRHGKGAQLVVVGSRGRGLFAGTVLGSTSLNLLHHSGHDLRTSESKRFADR